MVIALRFLLSSFSINFRGKLKKQLAVFQFLRKCGLFAVIRHCSCLPFCLYLPPGKENRVQEKAMRTKNSVAPKQYREGWMLISI